MNIQDCDIRRENLEELKGTVCVPEKFSFEVYGPFGQGYNIRVRKLFKKAELAYHWRDGPGAYVKTPDGEYEISDTGIAQGGKHLMKISSTGNFEPIEDNFALALFVVNYYFSKKMGPFMRKNA
jgi:hypothetical protein